MKEAQKLAKNPVLGKLEGASDDLYAWAASRVAREPNLDYDHLLIEMATYGLGELAKEAADLLEGDRGARAGSARLTVQEAVWDGGGPGKGKLCIDGNEWAFFDYKEEVCMTEELAALLKLPEPVKEKRQCVTLSLAAAVFKRHHGRWPSMGEAQQVAQRIRLEQTRLASEVATTLGEPEEMVSAVEHEARIYIHDLVTAHHEKDFRCLAMFPVTDLQEAKVVVLRTDFKGGLLVESVVGSQWTQGGWTIPVLIWKGHMVVLEPPEDVDIAKVLDGEEQMETPAFGFTFFWHSRHDQPRTAPGRLHCRLCKGAARKAGETPVCRPRSCLALIATMGSQGHEPMQVVREVAQVANQKDPNALVLQEVFAGTGRITTGWKKNGIALEPVEVYAEPHQRKGYQRSHDLLKKDVRERVFSTCKNGEANVWWIAAPCTSFCDWQLENGGSRTFACPEGTGEGPLGQREQEGNVLSTFSAELFEEALDHNQFPICESTASSGRYPKQWDLPAWRRVLNRPDVDFIEFPMCSFGLGPPDDPTAFYVHRSRLVFPKHWPLRQVLLRQCPGLSANHRHVALRGQRQGQAVTRCTEAGAYAWDFVTSVVAVLQSSLGGAGFHHSSTLAKMDMQEEKGLGARTKRTNQKKDRRMMKQMERLRTLTRTPRSFWSWSARKKIGRDCGELEA